MVIIMVIMWTTDGDTTDGDNQGKVTGASISISDRDNQASFILITTIRDNHEGPNEGHHFSPNFFNSADEMIHMTKQLTELKSYELSTRYQTSTVDKDLGQDPCQILSTNC